MIKIKVNNFDLNMTINSGQFFRFSKESNGSYNIILKDRVVNVIQDNNYIIVESNNYDSLENIIINFFDLNTDYNVFNKYILEFDINLKDIINFNNNFKILNMEPFETIISYIISQRNSVNNITNKVNKLSELYGSKVIFKDKEYYLFPTLKQLEKVSIEDYKLIGLGYRDKYIYNIVKDINCGKLNLNYINNLNGKEAIDYLKGYSGIGLKVASCILLFAYRKYDVFPIDTWIIKGVNEIYNINKVECIKNYCENNINKYSGILLQYIFNYYRNK